MKKVKYYLTAILCHCNNLVEVMARVYTDETLKALNKSQIIDLFFIASLTAAIKRLNENFQKLESDVSVVKTVNNILSKQMSSIDRQC